NSERYQRLARFVNEFFGKVDQFREGARHPKWAEFELETEIPGWTRFKPAANWILAHQAVAAAVNGSANAAPAFEKVLANYQTANGRKVLTTNDKELIMKQVKQILDKEIPVSPKRVNP
ncbi:MAG TPA: hypothetical protein VK281_12030, partial [Xanthobacteraceae bacterium]|nr:hypothetical protein [Xanthobacteraceae bacterium]